LQRAFDISDRLKELRNEAVRQLRSAAKLAEELVPLAMLVDQEAGRSAEITSRLTELRALASQFEQASASTTRIRDQLDAIAADPVMRTPWSSGEPSGARSSPGATPAGEHEPGAAGAGRREGYREQIKAVLDSHGIDGVRGAVYDELIALRTDAERDDFFLRLRNDPRIWWAVAEYRKNPDLIGKLLNILPPRQRTILTSWTRQDMPLDELARQERWTVPELENHLKKAVDTLRRHLRVIDPRSDMNQAGADILLPLHAVAPALVDLVVAATLSVGAATELTDGYLENGDRQSHVPGTMRTSNRQVAAVLGGVWARWRQAVTEAERNAIAEELIAQAQHRWDSEFAKVAARVAWADGLAPALTFDELLARAPPFRNESGPSLRGIATGVDRLTAQRRRIDSAAMALRGSRTTPWGSVILRSNRMNRRSFRLEGQPAVELAGLSAERRRLQSARNSAAAAVKAHMPEFGVADIFELKAADLDRVIARCHCDIDALRLSDTDDAEMRNRLLDMQIAAEDFNRLGVEMVDVSKRMGEVAGIAFALDRPGAVLLSPLLGATDRTNSFDVIAFVPNVDGAPPTLIVVECKGLGATLGTASTEYGRAEQGSPEYALRTARTDVNLRRILNETPEQLMNRGIQPGSPAARAVPQLITAHRQGRLRFEYHLVHADINGKVTTWQFDMRRNGEPVEINNLAGITRATGVLPPGRGGAIQS
ncbi:MAG: hypothetical protein J2P17_15495, partial [Mycobacterium sp.]|nr:hypothetical protein [Mycobacterium sp.]